MEAAFAEMPLALFTTLAPIGAGAFIALAAAFCAGSMTEEQSRATFKMTTIPVVVLLVGFAASFFHLASPLNAPSVLAGIGRSPLSNEIAVGSIFVIAALVFWILGLLGKLGEGARKGFAVVVAVLAVVFAVFTGMAYMMGTIVSWNTPLTSIEILGAALLGGALLGSGVLAFAKADNFEGAHTARSVVFMLGLVGFVAAAVAAFGHAEYVAGLVSGIVAGADLLAPAVPYLMGALVLGIVAVACLGAASFGKSSAPMALVGAVLAIAAQLLVRLAFYACQMSVGL